MILPVVLKSVIRDFVSQIVQFKGMQLIVNYTSMQLLNKIYKITIKISFLKEKYTHAVGVCGRAGAEM